MSRKQKQIIIGVTTLCITIVTIFSSYMYYMNKQQEKEELRAAQLLKTAKSLYADAEEIYNTFVAADTKNINQTKEKLDNLNQSNNALGKQTFKIIQQPMILKKQIQKTNALIALYNRDMNQLFIINNYFETDHPFINDQGIIQEKYTIKKPNELLVKVTNNYTFQSENLTDFINNIYKEINDEIKARNKLTTWLNKNESTMSTTNYKEYQTLVAALQDSDLKSTYEEGLIGYKKKLDEKIEKEKAEEVARQAELKKKEEEQRKKEIASDTTNQSAPNSVSTPTQSTTQTPRTDGFNFNGYHFPLSSFSGSGQVQYWTPYIYQWTDAPNHYLVELQSEAGSAIWSLGNGSTVTINGLTYTVQYQYDLPSGSYADDTIMSADYVTIQSCNNTSPNSSLHIWVAQ